MTSKPVGTLAVVDVPDSCGNAPRRAILRDFTISLYAKQMHELTEMLNDDVQWHLIGSQVLTGAEQVRGWVTEEPAVVKLTIHTIITHGREGGVDGVIERADGTAAGFCHVIAFAGATKTAKIKEIRSYAIAIPK